jgi:hypothetical protein
MNATATPARFVYTGRTTNWLVLALGVLLLVPLFLGSQAGLPASGLCALGGAALFIAVGSSLRTTAGPAGVTVRFGVLGWPRFRYDRERIAAAEVVTVPGQWSWGPWWTPAHGFQLTLSAGPALRLTLVNGRRVTVGMPDPAAAKEALGL